MTESQARDVLKQYFRVLKSAGDNEVTVPDPVEEARQLLGQEEVDSIERSVNAEQ